MWFWIFRKLLIIHNWQVLAHIVYFINYCLVKYYLAQIKSTQVGTLNKLQDIYQGHGITFFIWILMNKLCKEINQF